MFHGLKLTPKLINDLVQEYKNGKTTIEIAEQYQLSKVSVCRALKKAGITPQRQDDLFSHKVLSNEDVVALLEDFKNGAKIKDLTVKYKSSHPIITRILEANGLWTKRRYIKALDSGKETKVVERGDATMTILSDEERDELARKYVEEPFTKKELAELYKVHEDTVGVILRQKGIATKRFVPEEIKDQFCEEYRTGNVTIYDLAKIYELQPATIQFWLTKKGVIDITGNATSTPNPPKNKGLTAGTIRKMAREAGEDVIQMWRDIVNDPSAENRDRIAAGKALAERGFGKPKEEDEKDDEETQTAKLLKLVRKK